MKPRSVSPRAVAASLATALAGLLLLLAPALWNRFPFVFFDTCVYLELAFVHTFFPDRSVFYGLFLRGSGLAASPWLPILAQASLTLWLLAESQRLLLGSFSRPRYIAMLFALTLCSSLPWYVGQLMPDLFVPLMVLAIYLLARYPEQLGWPRRCVLLVTIVLAITTHASCLALAVGLLLVLLLARAVARPGSARPRPALPAMAVLCSVLSIVFANYLQTSELFLNRAGPCFAVARLMEAGIVKRLLDDTCPNSGYKLCAFRDRLPPSADEWLWSPESPFRKLGAFKGTHEEASRIAADCLRRYPWKSLEMALSATAEQLLRFKTGLGSLAPSGGVEHQIAVLLPFVREYLPDQVAPYLAARQQRDQLSFGPLSFFHCAVAGLSLVAAMALLGLALRRRRLQGDSLAAFVMVALVLNAFICGAGSGPSDRYQSRIVWLAVFAVLLAMFQQVERLLNRRAQPLLPRPATAAP